MEWESLIEIVSRVVNKINLSMQSKSVPVNAQALLASLEIWALIATMISPLELQNLQALNRHYYHVILPNLQKSFPLHQKPLLALVYAPYDPN